MFWMSQNNIEYKLNSIKFFVQLKNLNIPGIENEHTRTGNTKTFDIAKLEKYFGIIPDDPSDNSDADTDVE